MTENEADELWFQEENHVDLSTTQDICSSYAMGLLCTTREELITRFILAS